MIFLSIQISSFDAKNLGVFLIYLRKIGSRKSSFQGFFYVFLIIWFGSLQLSWNKFRNNEIFGENIVCHNFWRWLYVCHTADLLFLIKCMLGMGVCIYLIAHQYSWKEILTSEHNQRILFKKNKWKSAIYKWALNDEFNEKEDRNKNTIQIYYLFIG